MPKHIVGVKYACKNQELFLFKLVPIGLNGQQLLARSGQLAGAQAPNILSATLDMILNVCHPS